MAFLHELKRFQPSRPRLYAAVTDCRVIQFIQAVGETHDKLQFLLSPVEYLLDDSGQPAKGLRTLLALLCNEHLSHMPKLPWDGGLLRVGRYLGAGSSACVFAAALPPAVVYASLLFS